MIKAIKGVKDILPSEIQKWYRVEDTARQLFSAYNYKEIRLPVFEKTELFSRGVGETTDIVEKEMYTFKDKSGESLTLRPEGTASAVRAFLEHGMHLLPKPVKILYSGPMFRHEKPQAGRYRQFYQIGVEAIGLAEPAIDAEVIVMLMEFFRLLGIEDIDLQLNSSGCLSCRPNYRETLKKYLSVKRNDLCDDCRARIERNPMRVLDCKRDTCSDIIAGAPVISKYLCDECNEHFEKVKKYLTISEIKFSLNPKLVRGLDYYTRTTFEVIYHKLGAQNAIAGGGRYDGLVEILGGPSIPGIGFAIGTDRVALCMNDSKGIAGELSLYFIPIGERAEDYIFSLIKKVRESGILSEANFEGKSLKSQLDKANRLGFSHAVIIGDNELDKEVVILRDMSKGEQSTMSMKDFVTVMVQLKEKLYKEGAK